MSHPPKFKIMDEPQLNEDKKNYELALLLITEETASDVSRLLGQHGVEAASQLAIKKLTLAYKINGHDGANFCFVRLSAPPPEIKSLARDLGTNPGILRFLIISLPKRATSAEGMRPMRKPTMRKPIRPSAPPREPKPLSNEGLEKKIEEILK